MTCRLLERTFMSLLKKHATNMFAKTIPAMINGFFGGAKQCVIFLTVIVFALAWMRHARPHYASSRSYEVVAFDVFERRVPINCMRTKFKTFDVAWSFMMQYKKSHPLYNFALVSGDGKEGRQTIYKYI